MPPRLGPRALPAALESQLQAQLQQRRIHIDKIAAVVAFLQIAMGALDAVSRSGCRAVLFGSLVLHALQAWVMFGPRAEWYNAYRTLVAATLLVAVRLLTAFSIQGCNNPTSQVRGRMGSHGLACGRMRPHAGTCGRAASCMRAACACLHACHAWPRARAVRPDASCAHVRRALPKRPAARLRPRPPQDDGVTLTFRLLYKTGL